MITYNSNKQTKIEEFKSDFELRLQSTNRWILLSFRLPWDDLCRPYLEKLSKDKGAPGIDARIVVGTLYIKHQMKLSDREVIQTIQENPYMQFFLGKNEYDPNPVFCPSLLPEIRKRMGLKEFDKMNCAIIELAKEKTETKGKGIKNPEGEITHKGHLKVDATVSDQYIKYPTDLDLLNQCREWTETIIDEIFPQTYLTKKPRTYRRVARQEYLNVAKKKNKTIKEIRKAIKIQLGYVKRNLGYVDELLDMFEEGSFPLCKNSHWYLLVLSEVYRQQQYMYKEKTNQIEDRIVSLHQPYVRPIVRGKAKAKVEFGSKMSMSLDNGFSRIDRFSWDAFNECKDLQTQIEAYKNIHGYYPELLQGDKIYFTRENRRWLDEKGIRYTASKLGRPSEEKESYYQKRKKRKEAAERNQIEGKFGQGKNGYELNRIRARLSKTSESMIGCIVFVMNVLNLMNMT